MNIENTTLERTALHSSFTLPNGYSVNNRIIKSALSEALGTADNRVTHRLIHLYQRWAVAGAGVLITGNVMVDRCALGEPGNVVIEDERDLVLLKQWAAAAKAQGNGIWMQINHPGKQAFRGLNRETVSPSAIGFDSKLATYFAIPRALTEAEIQDIIQRFATTAAIAQKAGFTGVQLHGAHGYLISQFLSPRHNQRTDQWGGSAENRRRFVLEIYTAIREQVGAAFPIGIKLNSADFQRGGFSEEESLETIRALVDVGIDLVEISGGTYEEPIAMLGVQKDSTRQREAYFIDFAEKVRQQTNVPLLVTGGFRSLNGMQAALQSGALDFVGLGRIFAIEPDSAARLLKGEETRYQVKPLSTGIQYIDNLGSLEITWYTRQMHRLAQGKNAIPNESGLKSFLLDVVDKGFGILKTRRLRV